MNDITYAAADFPQSVFNTLYSVDLTGKLKKKNNLSYLPWSTAWAIVKLHYPDSTHRIIKAENGCNYHTDGHTAWVEVEVTIEGQSQTESLAVMDHRNKAIPLEEITSVEVNKSTKRALTKCCALFGLGLSLWNGEELSDTARVTRSMRQAAEQEAKEKQRQELAEANGNIATLAQSKIAEGVSRDAIYEVIRSFTGGKNNPNSIKDINISIDCYNAIAELKGEN